MQRRKKGRSFRVRSTKPARPLSFIITLILLAGLGAFAWMMDDHTGAPSDAPAPTAGATDESAPDGSADPGVIPTPSAIPTPSTIPAPPMPTGVPAPEQNDAPAAPANPMAGLSLFGVAYAEEAPDGASEQAGTTELPAEPTEAPTETPAAPTEVPVAPAEPTDDPAPVRLIEMTREPVDLGPLSGVTIGIDPGHQAHGNSAQEPVYPGSSETKAKVSSGTAGVRTRRNEYEVVLEIGLMLRDALEAQGATVYMTREINEVDISNVERAQMMNELGVDVVLRLHLNGSENSSVSGIGLYVKSSGEGAAESRAICDPLLAAMGRATGARTESVHVRDNYSGLNWSTVPSILVEMGYMSNPEEDEKVCSPEYQRLLVQGMVDGLIDYFAAQAPIDAAVGE